MEIKVSKIYSRLANNVRLFVSRDITVFKEFLGYYMSTEGYGRNYGICSIHVSASRVKIHNSISDITVSLEGSKINDFVDKMVKYYHYKHTSAFSDFGKLLESRFDREHILRTYGAYIVERFKDRKRWSGHDAIVTGFSYDIDRITLYYELSNGSTGYERYVNSERFDMILEMAAHLLTVKKQTMVTKEINNVNAYNSLHTLANKNICIIKYVRPGFSPLMSMTVGDFYIVEKTVNATGEQTYTLLNNNKMDRKSCEPIRVLRQGDSPRFNEFQITGWIEEADLEHREVNMCPVVHGNVYINPLTGKHYDVAYQCIYPVGLSLDVYKHNLQGKPGYQVLLDNTFGKFGKTGIVSCNTGVGTIAFRNDGAALTVKNSSGQTLHVVGYESSNGTEPMNTELKSRRTNPNETDDEREHRINHDNGPIHRHSCDARVGINEEYLLLNNNKNK